MAVINLIKNNFKEKVLKSKKPAMVDFWAEWCIAPDVLVNTGLRDIELAKDIKKGFKIISYKNGLVRDSVSYSKTTRDGNHCRKIKTERGREIKTTDDHLFYTNKGWQAARDLKKGDRVVVFPGPEQIFTVKSKKILVDEKDIYRVASKRMQVKRYLKQLKEKKLLPLRENNKKLLILARLAGFLFTDGTLYRLEKNNYREISFCLGQKEDVKEILKDLNSLGFRSHVSEKQSFQEIEGRKFTARTKRVKCLSTALWLLFKTMGVPEGNKTNQVYNLPFWLFKTTKDVKREFLAGFLGGDGPKLLMHESFRKKKRSYNSLTINDLEFYKREDLVEGGLEFGKQLKELFGKFGVEITRIFSKPMSYVRQDGTKTFSIHLKFRQDFNTGHVLIKNIGYAYSWQKLWASNKVGEFLRLIVEKRKNWKKIYKKVIRLEKTGLSPVLIAKKLDLSEGAVWGWLRFGRKPTTPKHFHRFPAWIRKMSKDLSEGFLWDYVAQVRKVYLPAVQRIGVKKNHNLIANEFLIHNCGPCRMAGPVIDELAEKYKGKVVVGKVNIDEAQDLAQKYGVMSIPTVIVFKNGKEVERKVGFPGKEGYEEMIKKVL